MSQNPSDPTTGGAAANSVDPSLASNPPAGARGPHAAPGDVEEVYYEGSPPARGHSGKMALYLLIGLLLLASGIALMAKDRGPWWLKMALILLGFYVPSVPVMLARSVRYRISNYRIDYERGILSKNIDTMELWHVEDLHFHQSLLDRIQNLGTITVIGHDETMPRLVIRGIPNPRPLYETLKQRVIAVKRQRGVIKMDPG
jgi:membrane protein YdbS with pleckstrin-like domain